MKPITFTPAALRTLAKLPKPVRLALIAKLERCVEKRGRRTLTGSQKTPVAAHTGVAAAWLE